MRNGTWTDKHLMCRRELDKLSTTKPIYLIYNGYHSIVCNTVGLELVGWKPEDCDDGELKEQDAFEASGKTTPIPDDTMDEWIEDFAKSAA